MEPSAAVGGPVRFGVFEVDLNAVQLRKRGRKISLQEQPFQVLTLLLRHPGEIVTREELQAALWPGGTIEEFEHGVNTAIKKLRKALGDSAENPRFIETLPRRGYRFLSPVEPAQREAAPPHYRILGEAGRGGMGVVYQAEDIRLHRRVALKFLPEELAEEPEALERLHREARSLAALNHPGICTLYGIEEHDGRPCLAMEFVEGRPLTELLEAGPLKLSQALDIAVQVAEALDAAHRAGIVHRDLKPANIMLKNDGHVKLLDFGLAKLLPRSEQDGTTVTMGPPTVEGAIAGTVAYMSPEQAKGLPVDARSDIFSFGTVLYEIVTGRRAFARDTHIDTLAAILHDEPPAFGPLAQGIPAELEELILRCLRKQPEARFQQMEAIRTALEKLARDLESGKAIAGSAPAQERRATALWSPRRRLAGIALAAFAVVVAAIIVLNVAGVRDRAMRIAAIHESPLRISSIAVLPFENLSRDPEQEYFADGIADALITSLDKIRALRVISRTTAMQFKGTKKTLPEIARELDVEAIVEGTVQRFGKRVRISVTLLHASTDRPLWAESYEPDLSDILTLQAAVARAVVREIRITVSPAEQDRLARARRVDPDAYDAYLKGMLASSRGGSIQSVLQFCHQAILKDSSYPDPYVLLAAVYSRMGFGNGPLAPTEALARSKRAALQALKLDATLGEALSLLAWVKAFGEWDWAGGETDFRRAIELSPGSALAHRNYSWYLSAMERHQEAIAEVQRARELDPLSAGINYDVASAYWWARQYERFAAESKKMTEMDSTYPLGYHARGLAYLQARSYDTAIQMFQKAIDLSGGPSSFFSALLGCTYGRSGNESRAMQILEEFRSASKHQYVSPYLLALIYASMGKKDVAFQSLAKAYAERNPMLAFLKVDEPLDPLRSDPRFQDLVRRVRFPQ